MRAQHSGLWVVYRMAIKGSAEGANAVCTESEWAEMEATRPGQHTLLRSRIRSEAEAERLARGTSGDTLPKGARKTSGPAAVAAG